MTNIRYVVIIILLKPSKIDFDNILSCLGPTYNIWTTTALLGWRTLETFPYLGLILLLLRLRYNTVADKTVSKHFNFFHCLYLKNQIISQFTFSDNCGVRHVWPPQSGSVFTVDNQTITMNLFTYPVFSSQKCQHCYNNYKPSSFSWKSWYLLRIPISLTFTQKWVTIWTLRP